MAVWWRWWPDSGQKALMNRITSSSMTFLPNTFVTWWHCLQRQTNSTSTIMWQWCLFQQKVNSNQSFPLRLVYNSRSSAERPHAFVNGISQLAISQQMTSVSLSTVPNGGSLSRCRRTWRHSSLSLLSCISHIVALHLPGPPQIMNMILAVPLSQTPPPHVTASPAIPANGTVGGSPSPTPPSSDIDSVKLVSAPNGNITKGAMANGTNNMPPTQLLPYHRVPTSHPANQLANVSESGHAIAYFNSAQWIPHCHQWLHDPQCYLHALPSTQWVDRAMAAGASLNLKLGSGQQWNGVAPPL